MKFADNLKKIRKSKNISQEELASKVGVSRQSVSKWETSEAYPEMNNILELCKIFHCHINDLVNDNMIDLDSLDEDVKMSIVKLKKEKQKQMKDISNILSLLGKIGAIVLRVAFAFLILFMVSIPILLSIVDVENDKIISKNDVVKIIEHNGNVDLQIHNSTIAINIDDSLIENAIMNYSKPLIIICFELGSVVLGAFIICMIKTLEHLEKLFTNIKEGDTPFTLDNVEHIRKMFKLLIACIILSMIGGAIINIPFKGDLDIDVDILSIVQILFLYSMSLIFEYGYEIQLDSKGKMYDE